MNNNKKQGLPPYRAVIAGTGSFAPEQVITNDDLEQIVDTSDEWITTRTGIKKRHKTTDDETTAYLATEAAKKALEQADVKPEELEMIVVGTITPEMVFPSTACFVQGELGAKKAWAFDLAAACSGFVYGLSIVQKFIESGKYKNALVIGAETLTKITNYEDRASCILFGDGAGAAVLKRSKNVNKGVLYSTMASEGQWWETLNCQAYGSRYPAKNELDDPSKKFMYINGREIYQLAVRKIVQTVKKSMKKCNLTLDDIDMMISHQMNARIIESAAKRLKLPDEKVFLNIQEYGNTSAASVPIALDEWYRNGDFKEGDIIVLVAFGAGLTWGANVIKF